MMNVDSIQFYSIQYGSIQYGSIQFGSIQFSSVQFLFKGEIVCEKDTIVSTSSIHQVLLRTVVKYQIVLFCSKERKRRRIKKIKINRFTMLFIY